MNKKFLLCSWGLITALLTNFAFGQNDIYNSFTDYTGDILHGNHVKKTTLANNEGYYVGGIVDGGTEAFVAKTDKFGNAYWIKHITGLAEQETVMEIVDDILYFVVREHNGVVAYAFEHDGSMHGNFPILLAHASYPDIEGIPLAIKPFYSGTTSDLRIGVLMSDIATGPDLVLWAFETDGTIDFIRRYDAPAWNQTNVAATFVQKNNTNRDLCIIYGTDQSISSIAVFDVLSTTGALVVSSSDETEFEDPSSGSSGAFAIHDALFISNEIIVVGAFNHEPIVARINTATNEVSWVDYLHSVYSSAENHAVSIATNQSDFFVMTSGFSGSPHPTPESMQIHLLNINFVSGITTVSSTDMRLPTPFNFRAMTSYPASLEINFGGDNPAFTSHTSIHQLGTPFFILDNTMDLSCPLDIYSIAPSSLDFVANDNSSITDALYNNHTPLTDPPANKIPRPEHQCITCSPGLMVDIDVTGAICGGGTATLTANIVTAIANPIYIWYPNGESTSSIQVTTTGTYTLLVIDPDGGCYEMTSVNINDNSSWHAHSENSNNNTTVVDVEKDDQNNIYIIGTFENTAEFENVTINSGTSPTGAYIAKYNLCGDLQWVACTEDNSTSNAASYRGVDLEFRNGNLHFLIGYDQPGSSVGDLVVYDAITTLSIGSFSLNNVGGVYAIGSLSPDGTNNPTLVSFIDVAITGSDSLRALDFFDNGTNEVYVVAGRQNGIAYIAELEIDNTSYSPISCYVESSSNNKSPNYATNTNDIIYDIEYYEAMDATYIYVAGKYYTDELLDRTLPNSPNGAWDAFVGKIEINSLGHGIGPGGAGRYSVSNIDQTGGGGTANLFAEALEIDFRKRDLSPTVFTYDIYVTGNFNGVLSNWNNETSNVDNAFVTMLEESAPVLTHRWTEHFDDSHNINYIKGAGVIVDDANNMVHAVGMYDANIAEIPGGSQIPGNLGMQYMWNLCLNANNGSERWLNGAESDEDIYVAGVAEFNRNAYVGGYYSSDVNFFNFVVTSNIPYASTPSNTDAFLARYGEQAGSNGPFYKNSPTTHVNNIQLQEELSFSIIPNPTSNQATIQLKGEVNSPWAYSLFNLMGAEIVNRNNITASKKSDIIQLNSLPPGVYVLVISHGETISSSKLIVQ